MPSALVKASLPVDLVQRLTERAQREHRTMSNLVRHLLEDALSPAPQAAAPAPAAPRVHAHDDFLDS